MRITKLNTNPGVLTSASSLIGTQIGNYRIVSKLGEGGMGTVYLGEHPLIGKRVAVKVLLPSLVTKEDVVNRFFNEAKAVNDIGHQNIVDIIDFGRMPVSDGSEIVYFIMEYLEGESLSSRLQRAGMTFDESVHVMAQCCSALASSHTKGVVHRDLKPENIYLVSRGNDPNFVKILDFGIAKLTSQGGQSSQTRAGLVIGTPAYMSPEQCEGKGAIDHRSDIYSLGVLFYELLTGRVPFIGEGFGEVLIAHITRAPDRPSLLNPQVLPELESIVLHALEKDPNRRFQSMAEFGTAVRDPRMHQVNYQPLPDFVPWAGSGRSMTPGHTFPAWAPARSATLATAAAEVDAWKPRSRAPLLISFFVALILLGSGAFYYFSQIQANDATVKPMVEQLPTIDEPLTIRVVSDPPGAKVVRIDQGELGVTPIEIRVNRGEPSFDVQLQLAGYEQARAEITAEKNTVVNVSLAKETKPPDTQIPVAPVADNPADAKAKAKSSHHHRPSKGPNGGGGDEEGKLLAPSWMTGKKP